MKNKLYLEYARVINMCKDTALEETPWICVKYWGNNFNWIEQHPMFIDKFESYDFAVAVVENKPVFVGDKVFIKDNKYPEVNWNNFEYWKNQVEVLSKDWTWEEPKKTFKLDEYEFPCPNEHSEFWSSKSLDRTFSIDNKNVFLFNTKEEAKLAQDTLIKIFKKNLK